MDLEQIVVRSTLPDGRVALWDRDKRHPGGEVFIADGHATHQVARTDMVEQRIREGSLIIVPKKPAKPVVEAEPVAEAVVEDEPHEEVAKVKGRKP